MEAKVPVMISFGNQGGLRSFKLCEVKDCELLSDLIPQYGSDSWDGDQSGVSVKISSCKNGGFDKFSLTNSVGLILRVLKTDVLWIVFEKSFVKPVFETVNAFDVLKEAQVGKVLPPKIEKPFNQKQALFNHIIDIFDEDGVRFSHSECAPKKKHSTPGTGTQLLHEITEIAWKVGQCEKQLKGRHLWNKIPEELLRLITFENKSKEPVQMSQHTSKLFATQIRETTDRALMALTKLGPLRIALLKAAEVFMEYEAWLKINAEQWRSRSARQSSIGTASEAIIRQIGEREKVTVIEKGSKSLKHPVAMKIFEDMKNVAHYEPLNMSVLLPTNSSTRKYILHSIIPTQSPERFVIWSFQNGAQAPQSLFAISVDQNDSLEQIFEKIGQLKSQLQNLQKFFYPREFYQQFYSQVGAVTGISDQELKLVSSMIIGDGRKFTGDVQDRFEEAIMSCDPDFVFDLREFNGREIKFTEFLDEFRSSVEDYMVEDRGRHEMQYDGTVVSKVSMGFSLRNVFQEVCKKVKEKLPHCPLPKSEHFLHRYLIPRTKAAAESLTRQAPLVPLKLASQQKVIEKPNIDAHYNAAQYKYLRSMAVDLGPELVTMIGWDDKTGVDVGEPQQPTAATQHTGKSWIHQESVAGEGQHSFHKTNLTPSVRFVHEIPRDMTGSFYRGQPQVAIKDAIFQPSNSARHATELGQMFHSQPTNIKPVLFLTNDGGSDHTIRYERNVVAMLAVFLHFPQIQLLINFQLAAYRSAYHPVEKLNCLLNLAWNGISLAREKLEDPVLEKIFASCNSMKDARTAAEKHPGLVDAVSTCLKPSVDLLEERAKQANLKENFFETFDPASLIAMKEFFEILKQIDEEFDVDDYFDKSRTYHYSPAIKAYLETHAVFTYYSISFKRHDDLTVKSLEERFPFLEWPADLEALSCPILDKENPGKYLQYEEVKKSSKSEKDFTDKFQPAKNQKIPSNIPFAKNKQRALYGAQVEIVCEQCSKQRVVYFKYKPTRGQIEEAADALKQVRYICGGRISSFGRSLAVMEEIAVTDRNIVEVTDEIDFVEFLNRDLVADDNAKMEIADEILQDPEAVCNPDIDSSDDSLETNYEPVKLVDLNSNSLDRATGGDGTGPCNFCGNFSTGHHCKTCRKLCCNFCNTITVEELSDILCPTCAEQANEECLPICDEEDAPVNQVKRKRGRPSKPVQTGQILIPLVKKKRGRPAKAKTDNVEEVKKPRGRPSKATMKPIDVEETNVESSDEDEKVDKPTELRILGNGNILSKFFVDEALTCESTVEAHMFDVLINLGKPLPCFYCGEKDLRRIKLNLTDEKFPLCEKCQISGRGAGTRRKSRKFIPKPVKPKKTVDLKPKGKKKSRLID